MVDRMRERVRQPSAGDLPAPLDRRFGLPRNRPDIRHHHSPEITHLDQDGEFGIERLQSDQRGFERNQVNSLFAVDLRAQFDLLVVALGRLF